jgi:hypothetical protein
MTGLRSKGTVLLGNCKTELLLTIMESIKNYSSLHYLSHIMILVGFKGLPVTAAATTNFAEFVKPSAVIYR